MTKDNVCKICRRAGQKLFLKGDRCYSPKCALTRKPYAPGQKGKRRKGKLSGYGKELREKQELKEWYRLSESQLKRYITETLGKRGRVENLEEELIKRLEQRLDNVIFQLGLAKSRNHAKQLVSHGFFLVNNKPVDIPSFQVKKDDVITIKKSKKEKATIKELKALVQKKTTPSWLQLDKEKLEGKVVGIPSVEEAAPPVELSAIFEFYSR